MNLRAERKKAAAAASRDRVRGVLSAVVPDVPAVVVKPEPTLDVGVPAVVVDKKTARVIRNREVALRARLAVKAKMKNLQTENTTLKSRATHLEVENSTLRIQIEGLKQNLSKTASTNWHSELSFESIVRAISPQ